MNAFKISVRSREDVDPDAPATQCDLQANGFAITVAKHADAEPDAPATQCDAFAPPPPAARVTPLGGASVSLSPLSD